MSHLNKIVMSQSRRPLFQICHLFPIHLIHQGIRYYPQYKLPYKAPIVIHFRGLKSTYITVWKIRSFDEPLSGQLVCHDAVGVLAGTTVIIVVLTFEDKIQNNTES